MRLLHEISYTMYTTFNLNILAMKAYCFTNIFSVLYCYRKKVWIICNNYNKNFVYQLINANIHQNEIVTYVSHNFYYNVYVQLFQKCIICVVFVNRTNDFKCTKNNMNKSYPLYTKITKRLMGKCCISIQ